MAFFFSAPVASVGLTDFPPSCLASKLIQVSILGREKKKLNSDQSEKKCLSRQEEERRGWGEGRRRETKAVGRRGRGEKEGRLQNRKQQGPQKL